MVLGADDETKAKLEKGKRPAGKPRVAGSARGRELRAAAALSRFEVAKEEPKIKDEDLVTDSETESDIDDQAFIKTEPNDAVDIHGEKLLDLHGNSMVKVCEDDDKDDEDAKRELQELRAFGGPFQRSKVSSYSISKDAQRTQGSQVTKEPKSLKPKDVSKSSAALQKSAGSNVAEKTSRKPPTPNSTGGPPTSSLTVKEADPSTVGKEERDNLVAGIENGCPICSVENEPTALTCAVCSNVLRPEFVANSWRCKSSACQYSKFVNAGDVRLCSVCGSRKCS